MSSLSLVFHCQSHPIPLFICPFKNQLWTWSQKRLLDCQIGSMIYQKKSIFQYNNNISIPEELLEEILSRLPVKSLTRFTSVQKPWSNTLLQNPTFIANHLLLQQTNPNPTLFFKSFDQLSFLCTLHILMMIIIIKEYPLIWIWRTWAWRNIDFAIWLVASMVLFASVVTSLMAFLALYYGIQQSENVKLWWLTWRASFHSQVKMCFRVTFPELLIICIP